MLYTAIKYYSCEQACSDIPCLCLLSLAKQAKLGCLKRSKKKKNNKERKTGRHRIDHNDLPSMQVGPH